MARRNVRKPGSVMSLLVTLVLVAGYLAWHSYQVRKRLTGPQPPVTGAVAGPNELMGRPRYAVPRPGDQDYFMDKGYFVLSYNSQRGEANWVSWRVTSQDLGDAPRKQLFDADASLPAGFTRITHNDYRGSGFDRGHLCPHGDRGLDQASSFATFVMTNVIPQAPNVNQRAWEQLESYGRTLARRGHRLYITSGPAGEGGTGKEGFRTTIARGRVVVPASCWKVIVVAPGGAGDDLASVDPNTRVIAVNMPNDNSVGDDWGRYRTSVAAVEDLTGLVFFDNLPPAVAAALKHKVDQAVLPAPTVRHNGGGE